MERQQFIYLIEPARSDMPEGPTSEEARLAGEHFDYLMKHLAAGNLVLAGRTLEPPYIGIAIFEAEDSDAAARFAEEDPAIAAGVFRLIRVQPYRVAPIRA